MYNQKYSEELKPFDGTGKNLHHAKVEGIVGLNKSNKIIYDFREFKDPGIEIFYDVAITYPMLCAALPSTSWNAHCHILVNERANLWGPYGTRNILGYVHSIVRLSPKDQEMILEAINKYVEDLAERF